MSENAPSGNRRNTASPQPLTRSRLLVAVLGLLVLVGVLTVPGFAGAQSGGDASDIGSFEAAFEASDKFEFEKNARFGPSKPPFGSDSSKCVLVPPDEQDQKQRDADPTERWGDRVRHQERPRPLRGDREQEARG